MNILVANDDGYDSAGLKILVEKLSVQHNVYVVAPSSNRSAVSHHITMYVESEIKKIDERTYACSGFPADCISVGLRSDLLNVKFDCVISGINYGGNLGTDIIYSGTCAAARQAVLYDVPGIAVSLDPIDWGTINQKGWKFDALCDFLCKNLSTLISMCNTSVPKMFVNINGASLDSYKGVKVVNNLCCRDYNDSLKILHKIDEATKTEKLISKFVPGSPVLRKTDSDSQTADFELAESFKEGACECRNISDTQTDYEVVKSGYIAVSVVYAEPLGVNSSINCDNLVL